VVGELVGDVAAFASFDAAGEDGEGVSAAWSRSVMVLRCST
jgi:hypothetical protein